MGPALPHLRRVDRLAARLTHSDECHTLLPHGLALLTLGEGSPCIGCSATFSKAEINQDWCKGCGRCVEFCSQKAIELVIL